MPRSVSGASVLLQLTGEARPGAGLSSKFPDVRPPAGPEGRHLGAPGDPGLPLCPCRMNRHPENGDTDMSTSTSNPVPIASFHGTYRFLSNFWLSEVRLPGDPFLYPSVEHAYQASKTTDLDLRASIRSAPTPGDAKRR